ncbi:hypothetical protein [Acetobacter sp.]|uniref:hypothetical protein n=1 Tax=Acetobacter sp. TaxID=440 RepID=UPI0039EC0798
MALSFYTPAQDDRLAALRDARDAVISAIQAVKALGADIPEEFENAEGPMLDLYGDLGICIDRFDDTLREEHENMLEDAADARRDFLMFS